MGIYTPTRRGNPCQICGDTVGRCREIETRRLCMTVTSGDAPGFKFLGLTEDGLWGKFIEHTQDLSSDRLKEIQEERAQRQRQQAEDEAKLRSEAMPVEERDSCFKKILSQLEIHPDDLADLHKRGLTDSQIEAWGVKSVGEGQLLKGKFPGNLPGLNLDKKTLNTAPGYLCPIRDENGLIVGCQIRLRESDNGGRYRWLSKHPIGARPHLPNGELPLSVHRPIGPWAGSVALVEGTGAKPFITAQSFNQVVIGAAGGQFPSSPETLKGILESLGTKTLDFYPDAGSVRNHGVFRQYWATWELLKDWGYEVRIGWWGQVNKGDGDIDELTQDHAFSWITPAEFWAIAQEVALKECQDLARALGISPDSPLSPEDLKRAKLPSRLTKLPPIELMQLRDRMQSDWECSQYRAKVRALMHRLQLDWTHPAIAGWLAKADAQVETLQIKHFKELEDRLLTVEASLKPIPKDTQYAGYDEEF